MQLTSLATLFLTFVSLFVAARHTTRRHVFRGQKIGVQHYYAPSGAHLSYLGGPVISNVEVVTVYWGGRAQVKYAAKIDQFYAGVTNSKYMDWLTEYNTPTQQIGRGKLIATYSYSPAPTGTITSDTVERMLKNLVTNGKVPKPTANTYYAIHFAPGITINDYGDLSCREFCAYHYAIKYSPRNIYYGVIPDQGGSCSNGCNDASTVFDSLCSVASHELIEAVTDPDFEYAWYDNTYDEIADICGSQIGRVVGGNGITFTVQKEFSNSKRDCIVSK